MSMMVSRYEAVVLLFESSTRRIALLHLFRPCGVFARFETKQKLGRGRGGKLMDVDVKR